MSLFICLARGAQRLKLLEHDMVGVNEAVDAVRHARLFVFVQLARRDLAGDTLAETDVGEAVDRCFRNWKVSHGASRWWFDVLGWREVV